MLLNYNELEMDFNLQYVYLDDEVVWFCLH